MSRNLVVHYKRVSYLIEPTAETLNFGRRKVRIHEWEDAVGSRSIATDGSSPTLPSTSTFTSILERRCWKTNESKRSSIASPSNRQSVEGSKHQEQRSEA